ncbi:MAG: PqqD family protein [Coriobacteriales bacterium]|nr:PqqD family protein [Coriobacteriales bacterium]
MKQNDAFVMRDLYGHHILMPVRKNDASDDPIALNDVGADIWRAANDCTTAADLVASVASEYGLEEGSPEKMAVSSFVDQLAEMGVLLDDGKGV